MSKPSRRLMRAVVAAAAGLLIAGAVAEAAPRRANTPAVKVDPAAVAAFNRMSDYVAGLKTFAFKTTYSFDVVAKNGQAITVDGVGHYLVKRPDKLVVDVENDLFSRKYIYDGKTLVVLSPKEKYFARIEMGPTVREMLASAAREHALEIPVADLFALGTPQSPIHRVNSAFLVGTSVVDGVEADHWAFRSGDRDWELWIGRGDKPLPLKLTLADRNQRTHPRYSVTLHWTDRADIADADFAFSPSADHKRIEILRVGKAKGSK